jgi:hypothetical protein
VKPQPARYNAVGKTSPGKDQATERSNAFVNLSHGRWRGRHNQGGEKAVRILEPAAIGCDAGDYDSDSDWSPADEFEGLDDVSLPIASDNVPRSIPCQKPVGNVIIQDGPMPEPSRGGSKQYQSPTPSSPGFASPPMSKPTAIEFSMMMPELLKEIESLSAPQILAKIKEAMRQAEKAEEYDQWLSPEGQEKLKKLDSDRSLSIFDYAPTTKASLCAVGPEEEWYEVELTADTGACDTVIPKLMCPGIPITPSMQSLRGMEYEVATGESIPNLGEKRCEMWTEGATSPKSIAMQVADVHKALLSLSRCADMGFESRFGSAFGCLIDTVSGEITPLQRRGNLYILRAWIRAAPFGRPETKR